MIKEGKYEPVFFCGKVRWENRLRELLRGGHFYEVPRWHGGKWWLADFHRGEILTVTEDGNSELFAQSDKRYGGLGWLPDGSLIAVVMLEASVVRFWPDGRRTLHADLSSLSHHPNDMVVDAVGNAYVGDMGFNVVAGEIPKPGILLHVSPTGNVSVAAEQLWMPNGAVIAKDGSTLIVGEMLASRYTAFTIGANGSLSDRHVWAAIGPPPEPRSFEYMVTTADLVPDGCGIDGDDHVWSADLGHRRVVQLAEGGEILNEISPPDGFWPDAVAVGGRDGKTVLVCAAPIQPCHLPSLALFGKKPAALFLHSIGNSGA